MIFLGVMFGIAIMGAMVYLAFDKKSSFQIRVAALAALGVMILTVIICLVLVLTDNTVIVDESVLIVGVPQEIIHEGETNVIALFFSIFFLLAFFIVVVIMAMKEHKKNKPKFYQ